MEVHSWSRVTVDNWCALGAASAGGRLPSGQPSRGGWRRAAEAVRPPATIMQARPVPPSRRPQAPPRGGTRCTGRARGTTCGEVKGVEGGKKGKEKAQWPADAAGPAAGRARSRARGWCAGMPPPSMAAGRLKASTMAVLHPGGGASDVPRGPQSWIVMCPGRLHPVCVGTSEGPLFYGHQPSQQAARGGTSRRGCAEGGYGQAGVPRKKRGTVRAPRAPAGC